MADFLAQLPIFIIHHWVLWLLFIIALAIVIAMEVRAYHQNGKRLSSQQVAAAINRE